MRRKVSSQSLRLSIHSASASVLSHPLSQSDASAFRKRDNPRIPNRGPKVKLFFGGDSPRHRVEQEVLPSYCGLKFTSASWGTKSRASWDSFPSCSVSDSLRRPRLPSHCKRPHLPPLEMSNTDVSRTFGALFVGAVIVFMYVPLFVALALAPLTAAQKASTASAHFRLVVLRFRRFMSLCRLRPMSISTSTAGTASGRKWPSVL